MLCNDCATRKRGVQLISFVVDAVENTCAWKAESATDKRFLQSLKKNTTFSSSLVACVVDESHTVETWTGLR